MAESRVRIGSGGPLSPDEVAHRSFPTTRRGFDPAEVQSFLASVANELRRLRQRIDELERVPPAAEPPEPATTEPAAPHPPAIDIATLTAALGEETARVLRAAQEAAVDVRARAEDGAARTLREAHEEASRLRAAAESVLSERTEEADAMATKLRNEVQAEADALRNRSRAEAEAEIQAAVDKGREMVGEAQAARERMLTDLARRRKSALLQLEQLRAGRERLLDAYHQVRRSLDEITDELERADVEAKAAADAAARRSPGTEEGNVTLPDVGVATTPVSAPDEPSAPAEDGDAPEPAEDAHPEPEPGSQPVPSAEPPPTASMGDAAPVASLPSDAVGGPSQALRGRVTIAASPASEAVTPPRGVDQLFAKLRADRGEAADPEVLHTDEPSETAGEEVAPAPDGESLRSDEDERLLLHRDELVDPLAANLTRKLKRLLQDEQNLLLDRLRTHRGRITAEAVLPAPAEHSVTYAEAAAAVLVEAEQAGAALAADIAPPRPDPDEPDAAAIGALAGDLATELVEPLRRKLERALGDAPDDVTTAADAVNAAYREIKSRRIERAVGDQLAAALSLGIRRVLPPATPVVWIVDDVGGACPDCDDNALAGPTALGEVFPTGQVGPPAHPGCRCLLGPPPA